MFSLRVIVIEMKGVFIEVDVIFQMKGVFIEVDVIFQMKVQGKRFQSKMREVRAFTQRFVAFTRPLWLGEFNNNIWFSQP